MPTVCDCQAAACISPTERSPIWEIAHFVLHKLQVFLKRGGKGFLELSEEDAEGMCRCPPQNPSHRTSNLATLAGQPALVTCISGKAFIYLLIYLFVHPSIHPSIYLPTFLSNHTYIHFPPIHLSIDLSICHHLNLDVKFPTIRTDGEVVRFREEKRGSREDQRREDVRRKKEALCFPSPPGPKPSNIRPAKAGGESQMKYEKTCTPA